MQRRPPIAVFCIAVSLAACSPEGEPSATDRPAGFGDELAVAERAIDVVHEAVLTFQADWNVIRTNTPILAGGTLKVAYDPQRLPNCRAVKYGLPAWSILMYYETPGRDATYVPLSGHGDAPMTATIDVPEDADTIALWFFNNDYYGCQEYDSSFGQNYRFAVLPPLVPTDVVFTGDWQEYAEGTIHQGGAMRLEYAPGRLQTCRYAPAGARAWNIFASYAFEPGGESGTIAVYEGDLYGGDEAIGKPVIPVPGDATGVTMWWSNSDADGCVAWDSDFGVNYHFDIGPPAAGGAEAGWAGDYDFVLFVNEAERRGDVDPVWYFDDWEGMAKASWVEVQVWIPGITDQTYDTHEAAAQAATAQVMAQAVTDGFAGDGPDGWGTVDLDFERQQGNNFVYSFRLGELRWDIAGIEVPDGLHHYYFRFSTDGGADFFETRGAETGLRRYVVAPTLDCGLFPDTRPPACPEDRSVGWAGNWGRYRSHACYHEAGVPDPIVFTRSAAGHDCMSITAEVWVEGVTDAGGSPGAVLAEVETDLGFAGGPLTEPTTHPLAFDGLVGNNFRYVWHVGQQVGMADRDDYRYRYRFSADGGATWTALVDPDDPAAEWRALHIRNDSNDIDEIQYCEDLELWSNPSTFHDWCVDYEPALDAAASFCELYVNALGDGHWSHTGATLDWLEAYVRVGAPEGTVVNVGMWTRYAGADEVEHERLSLGSEIEPGYWMTGFTDHKSTPGFEADAVTVEVLAFAFFIDVLRPSGEVHRLWQSNGGANYTLAETFAIPGYSKNIGSGDIEYADESAALFDQKRACAK